jgi:hypothetical protein
MSNPLKYYIRCNTIDPRTLQEGMWSGVLSRWYLTVSDAQERIDSYLQSADEWVWVYQIQYTDERGCVIYV